MSDVFFSPRVSKTAVSKFFHDVCMKNGEIHAVEIYEKNGLLLRIAVDPYKATDKREIYSLSKSFCSTAVGFLCDSGVISTEDRIIDLFPDKLPETVSENLSKMKLKHVLSMNTGHPQCVMGKVARADDAVKAFLAEEVVYEPGTHFTYNTGATCLLSCIVEKFSGMRLLDYLTAKFFMPLGIENVRWNSIKEGQNEGGCGIHVSVDDIAKLGLFYLNGGVWNGKRLLSEEWVNTATHKVSDNSGNGTPDWCNGYGYQFWINAREGYRGDGAFGQLCMVYPERDIVVAIQAEVGDMQGEIDAVQSLVEHIFDNDETNAIVLPKYDECKTSDSHFVKALENKFFKLDENPMGWTGVYFTYNMEDSSVNMNISNGTDQFVISSGNGFWKESLICARKFKPKLLGLMLSPEERVRLASHYNITIIPADSDPDHTKGKLEFFIRYLNCPHKMKLTVEVDGDEIGIYVENTADLYNESKKLHGVKI